MNWMTSAKRRAKLKRGGSIKHVRGIRCSTDGGNQTGIQDRNIVKHHMVTTTPQPVQNDRKRAKLNNNQAISRDIIFLRKSPPQQDKEHMEEKSSVITTLDINPKDLNEAINYTENSILHFNDGHRVTEDGSIIQGEVAVYLRRDFDDAAAKLPLADHWPQRFYSIITTSLGRQHQKRLEKVSKLWLQNSAVTPTEVLPFLYGALNGGPVSNTSLSDMSTLLDLIRYVEMVEKNSAIQAKEAAAISPIITALSPPHHQQKQQQHHQQHYQQQQQHKQVSGKQLLSLQASQNFTMRQELFCSSCHNTSRTDTSISGDRGSDGDGGAWLHKNIPAAFAAPGDCLASSTSSALHSYQLNDDFDIVLEGKAGEIVDDMYAKDEHIVTSSLAEENKSNNKICSTVKKSPVEDENEQAGNARSTVVSKNSTTAHLSISSKSTAKEGRDEEEVGLYTCGFHGGYSMESSTRPVHDIDNGFCEHWSRADSESGGGGEKERDSKGGLKLFSSSFGAETVTGTSVGRIETGHNCVGTKQKQFSRADSQSSCHSSTLIQSQCRSYSHSQAVASNYFDIDEWNLFGD